MSQRKETFTVPQMIERLRDMDKQIIHGGDFFAQCADAIENMAKGIRECEGDGGCRAFRALNEPPYHQPVSHYEQAVGRIHRASQQTIKIEVPLDAQIEQAIAKKAELNEVTKAVTWDCKFCGQSNACWNHHCGRCERHKDEQILSGTSMFTCCKCERPFPAYVMKPGIVCQSCFEFKPKS